MPLVPILNVNVDFAELSHAVTAKYDEIYNRLQDEKSQRKLVLVIVSIALLLDNMLYMVIVPIIPDFLRTHSTWETHMEGGQDVTDYARVHGNESWNDTSLEPRLLKNVGGVLVYEGEDTAIGWLFASKAIIQLMVNPFSGWIIDRVGYDKPMMGGLLIMFLSTAVFACGQSYTTLFLARSLQGVGSAFADTSGMAMIADRFTEENERQMALGIALAFISFGSLVAPPFGSVLYEFAGKEVPFLILSFVCLVDGIMLVFVMRPVKAKMKEMGIERLHGTPIWRLLMDPQIAVCAGALVMANVSLAFLEPTITVWMIDNIKDIQNWQTGMIWLPAFFPHVFGVVLTVKLARKYPQKQWIMAAAGLGMEGLSCLVIPFSNTYWVLMIPICTICFGIALIDTALLPTLGYLVDVRYVSVYGSIYAIADISYSMAYAIGPVIAGGIVASIGFVALNLLIAVSNLLYVPVLSTLKHIYDYKPFEDEANILMTENPHKQYQTYRMDDKGMPNSLGGNRPPDYGRLDEEEDPKPSSSTLGRTHFGNVNGHVRFQDQVGGEEGGADRPEAAAGYQEPVPPVNPFNPFRQS
ncbi:unnamed protein product [Darwinula stevensoni]|uniref:Major facilitator superfamily (MFS) profile domain-containing protein n=1 Tax=Darwinula stevensoni TaxID=69355 RepID=A0A7R9FRW0_9CRUS|nr:unnamed protein product [Darwinula stevensoni]CAG0901726.1 unnamed protein product [Darwinula stevensoni]